jgi:ABC-type transport system involved in multi-copper enzyme maturation permease subunit
VSSSESGAPHGIRARRRPLSGIGRTTGGIAAIGVKELRGRMRGRRAFVILTIYLLLLAGFAFMVETLIARGYENGFGGSSAFASAAIGQGIFAALLMLMTLQVVFLASSSTTGAISLEREKQTLDLLAATPISSVAIVVGKLLSALTYVFLLIAASIPLMAVVFVYGGIAPEDVVRGYLVLVVTAIGLGSFGLMCSSLVRRTTAATAVTIFGVLALTIGTGFILIFWIAMGSFDDNGNRTGGVFGVRAPAILAYVNPFIAQADVMCGTEATFGGAWCSGVQALVPTDRVVGNRQIVGPGVDAIGGAPDVVVRAEAAIERRLGVGDDVVVDDVAPAQIFEPERDALWPKSIVTWLVLSVVFLAVSVQMVSPTRRWRWRGRSGRGDSPPVTPDPTPEPESRP